MPSIRLSELASMLDGQLEGPGGDIQATGIASLQDAGPGDVCHYSSASYRRYLSTTGALAVITGRRVETRAANQIIVRDAYEAFRRALALFAPDDSSGFTGVHPSAVIHPEAVFTGASIGPGASMDRGSRVGPGTVVGAGCVIGPFAVAGSDCLLHPGVVLAARTVIGDRVVIHSGAVLGADGFGFVPDPAGHRKIPQIGRVVVEDDVEIGACCTIDRAVTGETRIGRSCKLDNLVHLAHNVKLGPGCLLAAQVGVAGSTTFGAGVVCGGQAGIAGHVTIGDGAVIAAQAGVTRSVPPGATVSGYPARPHRSQLRTEAAVARLPDVIERLRGLGIDKEKT